jgi:predicted metal-binding transcription factor (methanogenesis marker protein 9)
MANFKKKDIKKKMEDTCFGSIAFCCGLEKKCPNRDEAMKKLGITKEQFNSLKDEFDNNLVEVVNGRN